MLLHAAADTNVSICVSVWLLADGAAAADTASVIAAAATDFASSTGVGVAAACAAITGISPGTSISTGFAAASVPAATAAATSAAAAAAGRAAGAAFVALHAHQCSCLPVHDAECSTEVQDAQDGCGPIDGHWHAHQACFGVLAGNSLETPGV